MRLLIVMVAVMGLLSLTSCLSVPTVTEKAHLDQYVGRKIRIIGEVSNTKVPTIIGVEVGSYLPDVSGKIAEAEGVLVRWVVSEKQITEMGPWVQSQGAGVFFRLRKRFSNETVHAKPVNLAATTQRH